MSRNARSQLYSQNLRFPGKITWNVGWMHDQNNSKVNPISMVRFWENDVWISTTFTYIIVNMAFVLSDQERLYFQLQYFYCLMFVKRKVHFRLQNASTNNWAK